MAGVMRLEIILFNENSLSYNEEFILCVFFHIWGKGRGHGRKTDTIKNVDRGKVTEVNAVKVHCFTQLVNVGTI